MKEESKYFKKFKYLIDESQPAQVKMLEIFCFNCKLHDGLQKTIETEGHTVSSSVRIANERPSTKAHPCLQYLRTCQDEILKYYKTLVAIKGTQEADDNDVLDEILGG